MSAPPADPREFWCDRVPAQFNRTLEGQAARGERVHRAMSGVDATLCVEVDGAHRFFLNIASGRMSAHESPSQPPFVTLLVDRASSERLAREAGDSLPALLGALAGMGGEMPLTRTRVEAMRALEGLVSFEVRGVRGFRVATLFGDGSPPAEPDTTVRVDSEVYDALRSGSLDAESAFLEQRIRVEGDLGLALRLALATASPDPG